MRIHRLRVQSFRGLADAEVTFATTGVTIVEGPNEVGKSSLAEAISLVVDELDTSTKERVRSVRPVHRDEGTEVELELSTGDHHLVIRKRWFRARGIWLEVLAPRREQLTGREAHERLHAILAATADRELWEALRIQQGAEARGASLATRSVLQALDAVAGGTSPDDDDADLWSRITAEWATFFTATGLPRQDGRRLQVEVDEHRSGLARVDADLAQVEAGTDAVGELSRRQARTASAHVEAVARHAELAAEWDGLAGARGEVADRELARTRAEVAVADHRRASEARSALIERVAAASALAEERQGDHRRAVDAGADQARRVVEADQAVALALDQLHEAEAGHSTASAAAEHARRSFDLELLLERHGRVVTNSARLVELHAATPTDLDDDRLAELERLADAAVRARAVLDAGAGSFGAFAIDLVDGVDGVDPGVLLQPEGEPSVPVAAGTRVEHPLTGPVSIVVPGIGTVELTPGAGARDAAREAADAAAALSRALAQVGVADLAEARARRQAGRDAAVELATIDAALRADLRDLTPEVMAAKIAALADQLAAHRAAHPHEVTVALDDADAVVAAAADAVRDARARHAEALAHRAGLAAADEGRVADVARGLAAIDAADRAAAQAAADLERARAEVSDADLATALAEAEASLALAESAALAAASALAAHDPASLEARLQNAADLVARLADEQHEIDLEQARLRAFLSARGEDGLHHQRSELTASLARAERALAHHDRHAAAADLLHRTFSARRDAARLRYLAPFQERICRLGRIVYGPTFEVELDRDLRVRRRTLHGRTLDVADLSVGAREQLDVLTKLAGAATVSAHGGAPVIFDDTLGATSADRLEGMGAAIATAARECQVIVLTCTPERFGSVGRATRITLTPDPVDG